MTPAEIKRALAAAEDAADGLVAVSEGQIEMPLAGFLWILDSLDRFLIASRDQAAVVVVERADGLVLAVSRKDDLSDFGLPGGKREPPESVAECAARELGEETGVYVDPAGLRRVYAGPAQTPGRECVAFVAERYEGEAAAREGAAVEWVSWARLLGGSFGAYNRELKAVLDRDGKVRA